jgi:hypothetical protein
VSSGGGERERERERGRGIGKIERKKEGVYIQTHTCIERRG